MKNSFYITTPIYYVNDKPHIGHTYTTVAADAVARFERMRGKEVAFLTGTDENSQKNIDAAAKAGERNLQAYLDKMAAIWQETWDSLGISNTDFIRTTEPRHVQAVEAFWAKVLVKGDIYKGTYEGWYCTGCEAFKKDSDLVNGECPLHKKVPERITETNYFFKLTRYRDALLRYIDEHPDFIGPSARRNEVLSYIREFMEDVSISRETIACGIPVPGDSSQRIYVWFDALVNYISAIGYGAAQERFEKFWPGVHLVGKDIIKFHCALWPAMLMAADLPLPERVFAHGFFTINGEKISKSLGNAIDPRDLAAKFGVDTVRYILLREISFGEDGDFSFDRLEQRYRTELAGELGNLVYRVLSMNEKYCGGMVPARAELPAGLLMNYAAFTKAMENFAFHEALDVLWATIRAANKYIDETAPWKMAKEGKAEEVAAVMYRLLETIRHIGRALLPIMPSAAEGILQQLGVLEQEKAQSWEAGQAAGMLKPGTMLTKSSPLFPQLEEKA